MDDEAPVPDFDRTMADLASLEERLQSLTEATSVDFLGSSSRDFSNKLFFWASAGVVISTAGSVQANQTLMGFNLVVERLFVIPLSLVAVIVFYALALFVLGRTDYRRWAARYRRQSSDSMQTNRRLAAVMTFYMESARRAGHEAMSSDNPHEPVDAEGIPLSLKNRLADLSEKVGRISEMALSVAAVGLRVQRQTTAAALLFIGAPIVFGAAACGLLIRSAILLNG